MHKLIIADDEPFVCHALEHKIQNMGFNVELLPSVYNGVSLIKSIQQHKPDIAIVDIQMPGLNGLESVEFLKNQNLNFALIVSSAFSDYKYMQQAIKLEAVDYLLKPCGTEALAEAMEKAIRKLDHAKALSEELQREKKAARSLFHVAGEKWLLSLLTGNPDLRSWQIMSDYCPINATEGCLLMWGFYSLKGAQRMDLNDISSHILSYLNQFQTCVGINFCGHCYTFLLQKEKDSEEALRSLIEKTKTEVQKWEPSIGRISVGISQQKKVPDEISVALYEARTAFMECNSPNICFYHIHNTAAVFHVGKELISVCCSHLINGRRKDAVPAVQTEFEQLHDILRKKYSADTVLTNLKIEALLFVLELHQTLNLHEELGTRRLSNYSLFQSLPETQSLYTLLQWLENKIVLLDRCLHQTCRYNIHVEKTMLFIYSSYHKDISLNDAAQYVSVSPSHLSRLLMKYEAATFTEILTGIRINKSICLIKEGRKTIKEICFEVGYPNISYFYRVFKKTTGFTVSEFRSSLGGNPIDNRKEDI